MEIVDQMALSRMDLPQVLGSRLRGKDRAFPDHSWGSPDRVQGSAGLPDTDESRYGDCSVDPALARRSYLPALIGQEFFYFLSHFVPFCAVSYLTTESGWHRMAPRWATSQIGNGPAGAPNSPGWATAGRRGKGAAGIVRAPDSREGEKVHLKVMVRMCIP